MTEVIRNTKLEVVGYLEISDSREILRDRRGRELGVYDHKTKITRDRSGRIVGIYVNQLLRLL